jgi:hypothetical protein
MGGEGGGAADACMAGTAFEEVTSLFKRLDAKNA